MEMQPCSNDRRKSGRKERIVISCVTFETAKVVEPILFYDATRVHLINWVKDRDNPALRVYSEFLEEVVEQVTQKGRIAKESIIHHSSPVYDFQSMMRCVYTIIKGERATYDKDADIYVNVSSGTSEYTAAATIASMMIPDTKAFTVSTKEYLIPPDRIRDIYFSDGKPVGMSKTVFDPYVLGAYPIEPPAVHLVRGLKIVHDRVVNRLPVSQDKIITALIEQGAWNQEKGNMTRSRKDGGVLVTQSMRMFYIRNYQNPWCERGWMEKDGRRMRITEIGENVIRMFHG